MEQGSGRNANKFFKKAMVRVTTGNNKGQLYSEQIVAKIVVGGGPQCVTVNQLEGLLEGDPPIVFHTSDGIVDRVDSRIEIGKEDHQWTEAEIKEIIERSPKKRGRPKKEEAVA